MVKRGKEHQDGPSEELTFPPRSPYREALADDERRMVQGILRPAPPSLRSWLVHYYISAKSWPLVLLTGPSLDQLKCLFHLLAEGISGCSHGQIRTLPAQFPWQGEAGNGRYLESIRGRFNTVAFLDLLAEASTPVNESRAYFLCLERAAPAELDSYVALYPHPGRPDRGGPPPLPPNLRLTAILVPQEDIRGLPAFLLNQIGIVSVQTPLAEPTGAAACPPVGWQRLFLRSILSDPDQARQRLERFGLLGAAQELLAHTQSLLKFDFDPLLEAGLLRYLANSFTDEGEGLFNPSGEENLRQAIDIQLSQRLLPCVIHWVPWGPDQCTRLLEQLNGMFPRAGTRAQQLCRRFGAGQGGDRSR